VASEARDDILARVRTALGPAPRPGPGPPGARSGDGVVAVTSLVDVLVERLEDYRAGVTVVAPDAVADAVGSLLSDAGAVRTLVPVGFPPEWLPPGIEKVDDGTDVDARAMDEIGHVVTGCALAVASLGSLVFDHQRGQGRRAMTLVPDHHVCVVREDQIVASLIEAFDWLAAGVGRGHPVTFVSGPSATSDIELRRVEGVHGPRRLDVVISLGENADR
jgi:L-lactate dehydrogenase complex protein LldG